jgi:ribosomal protein L11 methyltransferase
VPYRIDVPLAGADALDRLVELGALDVDRSGATGVAALMPDHVTPEHVATTLGADRFSVAVATGRDADSVWVLAPREVTVGGVRIVPADGEAGGGSLKLVDSTAFGTGLHPTTALCGEALAAIARHETPAAVLDVGTGSGVLALVALHLGVSRAVALDIDHGALRAAAANAHLNGLRGRVHLVRGGPDAISAAFPLVLANILAAPLIEMAPALVRRVGHQGRLVLSGIPAGVADDVDRAYRRVGLHPVEVRRRGGWAATVLRAGW